ncbi:MULTISPECIES: ankyrin repeat domain-containing protein [Bacteria]|uniref:ankyrin repeat domain-containing protein n=1 Tax=Bacteria TaxID=2 RepID=UPI003C7C7C12
MARRPTLLASVLFVGVIVLAGCGPATPGPTGSAADRSSSPEGRMTADADALFAAAAAGQDSAVRTLIEAGADIEHRGEGGMTPLIAATKANRIEAARILIEAGADVNAKDDIQDSAYLYAGARGHDEILRMTLSHGADLRSTNRYGGTALIPAAERGLIDTARILLAAGVDPDHVNDLGWTALHEAIVLADGSDRYVQMVRLLLAEGADPAVPDGDGVLPRDLAADRGYDAIVAAIDG